MVRRKAALASLLVSICLHAGGTRADPLPLLRVVERLTEAGHSIVFSDNLIEPSTLIDLEEPSLAAFDRSLHDLGLQLERIGDHWIISRSSADRLPQPIDEPVPVSPVRLENVIVTGTRHRLAGRNVTGSLTSLVGDDLADSPSLGGDGIRATGQLPGMSSVGVSAKPWIRGGLQDELLVRIDGVELLDAYHLADFQSVFSIVDDRSVAAIDVYTGGFPARYGNRMSGVMDIVTGLTDDSPRTELGISMFSLLASREGNSDDGATQYLVSLRRGNLDQVIDVVEPSLGTPRYHDGYGRLDHQLSPTARLSGGSLVTRDDVSLEEDETRARSYVDSRYLWGRLDLDHGAGLTSSSILTHTWSRRSRSQRDRDDDTGIGGALDYGQELWKVGGRTDLVFVGEAIRMELGAEVEYGEANYDSVAAVDRGIIGRLLGGARFASHDIHVDPEGWTGGAYWAGEFPLGRDWLLQPGLRWDFQDPVPGGIDQQVSPRLGLRYQPTDLLSLRFDVGRFHQPQALHEIAVADGESGFSSAERADHYLLGLAWLISDAWEVRAEVYEKRYRRPRPRFENVFNPFVLVPELEPDRIRIAPERARARGVDLELSRAWSEHASAALSYSYMDAEDRLSGGWVPRRWSQRHTARASLSWRGPTLTAAMALTWHSGWRGADLPASIGTAALLDPADVLNSVELDDFFSLDVSIRRTWRVGRSEVTVSADITNLTNRRNAAGIEFEANEEGGIVTFDPEQENLLPLVPSLGVLVTF